MRRPAFTMIELIFVIVVIGILAKFGADIFRNTYDAYILSSVQNKLQSKTEIAMEQITNRLRYRIKDSVIASGGGAFTGLAAADGNATLSTLQWVGYDIDGWLGTWNGTWNHPTWSGFIDLDDPTATVTQLSSPDSNFTANGAVDTIIRNLEANGGATTTVGDAAIFFTGSHSDITTDYGWDGTSQSALQATTASHAIKDSTVGDAFIQPVAGDDFAGVDVYEYYKLAWTAYALDLNATGGLNLYYDFQPWLGENFTAGTRVTLMEHVSAFSFRAIGDMIQVQLCIDSNSTIGDYSICKEKAIF